MDKEEEIDLVYLEIISPENFVQNFKSKKEFTDYLDLGKKCDLEFALNEYEEEDMYEQCRIIKNFIETKFNQK